MSPAHPLPCPSLYSFNSSISTSTSMIIQCPSYMRAKDLLQSQWLKFHLRPMSDQEGERNTLKQPLFPTASWCEALNTGTGLDFRQDEQGCDSTTPMRSCLWAPWLAAVVVARAELSARGEDKYFWLCLFFFFFLPRAVSFPPLAALWMAGESRLGN